MLIIRCPWCGERDHTEFTYGGAASVARPTPAATDQEWVDYVYMRDNSRGSHEEYWHHVQGCRQWLRVHRDTMTHEIASVMPAAMAAGER